LLHRRAEASPAAVVVTFLRDDRTEDPVTFAALDSMATSVAGAITALRLPPGSRVLLPLLPGRDFLAAFWGVTRARMIAVPVPPPAAGSYAARFCHIAADCTPALTITSADLAPLLHDFAPGQLITVDQVRPAARAYHDDACQPDDPAYLQYTSGTSGPPRGAVVTHAQVLASCAMAAAALAIGAKVAVQWLPEFHDLGLLSQVLLPVYRSYSLHVMSPLAFANDPVWLLEEMSARRGNGTAMSYAAYELLGLRASRAADARLAGLRLDGWQLALAGADTADPARLRDVVAVLAAYGMPGTALHGAYGTAEANIICASPPGTGLTVIRTDYQSLVQDGRLVLSGGGAELAGCGKPVPGMTLRILDPAAAECESGTVGEVAVGGPGVATSYWGQPAPTVVSDGRPLLLTGDIGAVLDGELYLLGRKADVITDRRGSRHPACMIEAAASRAHAAVRRRSLAAFRTNGKTALVAETSRNDSAGEIATAIAVTVFDERGLWLDDVRIVPRRTIPLTTSGKVRRHAVRELYESGQLNPPLRSATAS